MQPTTLCIKDVNGNVITTYGQYTMKIVFNGEIFPHNVIICDITPDAIIGQDFLLKFVTKIDYQKMVLQTCKANIQCWVAGEAQMVCRVEATELITIPGNSRMFVAVDIPCCEKLGENVLIEPSVRLFEEKNVSVMPGILKNSPCVKYKHVSVHNFGDSDVTIHPKMKLGVCETYYENETAPVRNVSSKVHYYPEDQTLPDYLADLHQRSSSLLTPEERDDFTKLLIKYQNTFSKSPDDLGRTQLVEHHINTGQAAPIRQPTRRLPFGKRQMEKDEVQRMLKLGVIAPSNSSWSSPVVLVHKKNSPTPRFCVDYRKVNELTLKDAYQIPRVDECLDALSGSNWFGCVNLNSGFWQLGMDDQSKCKTAFSTSQGLYQFNVMPFGLANAPSSFERLMENVLRGLQWEECLLYLDDIIIPAATVPESLKRMENVFQRLQDAGLKLKPSKCIFFQKSVKFLGHIVSASGVQTNPEKTEAVQNWPRPKKQRHVRSFLGLCSYYRRFVVQYAEIARPLHKLCEKNVVFEWNDECENSFNKLKKALVSPPILAYPQLGIQFILDTDASDKAVGAVLSQNQDDKERVIAYMSKSMNKHEQNYCVTRKELLAVICALRKFHSYLYGQTILLRTDNAAVSWMRTLKTPTGQVTRWLQELNTYDLEVIHRPGLKHRNADALSRNPCKTCSRQERAGPDSDSDDEIPEKEAISSVRAVTRSQTVTNRNQQILSGWIAPSIRQSQLEDNNISYLFTLYEQKCLKPDWNDVSDKSKDLKILWRMWDRFEICKGVLYIQWYTEFEEKQLRLVVPEKYRGTVMKYYHDIPTAAHLGSEKTLGKIKQIFFWPCMKQYVKEYIHQCDRCAARSPCMPKKSRAPLGTYNVGAPMERIAIDILGPLPVMKNGNKFCLVITDCFTKWTEAYGIPNQEASTVAQKIINEFVCRFGAPLQIHTDQGTHFESHLFRQMCDLLCIEKTRTTSFRPQSNGSVERLNRTLLKMLSNYCETNQHSWEEYLPQVLLAYRSSIHSTTGFTPNFLTFGRDVTLPLKAVIARPDEEEKSYEDVHEFVKDLHQKMKYAHDVARTNLKRNTQYQKRHYDVKSKTRSFNIGQAVWLSDLTRKIGVCHKLSPKWKGPFIITRKIDDVTCIVKKTKKQTAKAYHVDRLMPYRGRNVPTWFTKL